MGFPGPGDQEPNPLSFRHLIPQNSLPTLSPLQPVKGIDHLQQTLGASTPSTPHRSHAKGLAIFSPQPRSGTQLGHVIA